MDVRLAQSSGVRGVGGSVGCPRQGDGSIRIPTMTMSALSPKKFDATVTASNNAGHFDHHESKYGF